MASLPSTRAEPAGSSRRRRKGRGSLRGLGRPTGRKRELSVLDALKMALCRLRTNATYAALGADFGVSTSVAWDYVHDRVDVLSDPLGQDPEGLAQSVRGTVVLVDGTLVPVVNWRHRRDLYSTRHRRCGVNLQVLVDPRGRLVDVSRWCPGSRHDMYCFTQAGLNTLLGAAGGMIGDKAYQGSGMVTSVRKPPGRQLPDAVRESTRKICKVRYGLSRSGGWRT